jgi:DNA-binding NarL/FixJ family response regulator
MPPKIVVVEDDHLDREWIEGELREYFRGADIELIGTERKFRERLQYLAQHPPDIIIFDIMLQWDTPQEGQKVEDVPKQVREEGVYTAGLRCVSYLKQFDTLKDTPYILYTGLDKNNFPTRVVHMKTDQIGPLISEIRARLHET